MYLSKFSSTFSVVFKDFGYISKDSPVLLQMPSNKIVQRLMKWLVIEMEIP